MKIAVVASDGSPLGVTEKDIYGENGRVGVGGAELAIMTLMRMWQEAGHEVIFFNNPLHVGESCFEQAPISSYRRTDHYDIHMAFRTPVFEMGRARGYKVWLSMDQYTSIPFGGYANKMDQTICISPYHKEFFRTKYRVDAKLGFKEAEYIDLPVRSWDYPAIPEKDPNMAIFTSVPDRGLHQLLDAWTHILAANPKLVLYVTSDYRLWGNQTSGNAQFKIKAAHLPQIKFLGALPRRELIDLQLKASYMFYPCIYDELFCIAIAEAQYAGVQVVSTSTGACGTTNMCNVVDMAEFIPTCQQAAKETPDYAMIRKKAIDRFSPEAIMKQWNEKVFSKVQ